MTAAMTAPMIPAIPTGAMLARAPLLEPPVGEAVVEELEGQ